MPWPRATRWSCAASAASGSVTETLARAGTPRPAAPWTSPRSAFPSSRSASACASSSTREGTLGPVRRLWAPWRMAWIGSTKAPTGCVFCSARDHGDDRKDLVLERSEHAFLILNAFPYASGHVMAVVKLHLGGATEAGPREPTDMMRLVPPGGAPPSVAVPGRGAQPRAEPGAGGRARPQGPPP